MSGDARKLALTLPIGAPADRLDKRLAAAVRETGETMSRAEIRRLVERGHVRVNDGIVQDPAAKIRGGARIELLVAPPPPSAARPDPSVVLDVVYEDEHLLVIDKPAGLVVHPARGHATGTLVNGLLARSDLPEDLAESDGPPRPGIVHRLDKGTSGLLVVAKDAATRESLKALFAAHAIDREYVAIVVGEAHDATFDTPHGRHPTDRLRFTSRPRGPSRRAITHVRVERRLRGATLVACTLETGRTHQIRVHLAEAMKTPILGDPLYGRRPTDRALAEIAAKLGHQALHARVLGFVHPATGEHMRWERQPPEDFRRALTELERLPTS